MDNTTLYFPTVTERLRYLFDTHIGEGSAQRIIDDATTKPAITIAGCIGSGKSVFAESIHRHFGFTHYNVGSEFRRISEKRGISVEELTEYLNNSHEESLLLSINVSYSATQVMANGSENGIVAEGQLTALYSMFLEGVPEKKMMRILLKCSPEERFKRIVSRDGCRDKGFILKRDECDRERWEREFHVDPLDLDYHLVIDTEKLTPDEMLEAVIGKWSQL